MLRGVVLIFCTFVSGCVMSSSFKNATAEYRADIEPSCYITFEDDYWLWRDQQPKSTNIEADLRMAMTIKKDFPLSATEAEKVLCEKSFLFSNGLARVMNYYGGNVTPNMLYSNLMIKLSDNKGKQLDFESIIKAVMSSLEEIELRFEEN